jgi:hypothetical protein
MAVTNGPYKATEGAMKVIMLDDEIQAYPYHWPVRFFRGFQQLSGTPEPKSRAEYDMQKICGFPLQDHTGKILPGSIYKETKKGEAGSGIETKIIMLDGELAADPNCWPVRRFDFGLEQFDGAPGLEPRSTYDMHRICDFAMRHKRPTRQTPEIWCGAIYEETRKDVPNQARNG